MTADSYADSKLLQRIPVRVTVGMNTLMTLGEVARAEGAGRVLLVSDPGVASAGHVDRAEKSLADARLSVTVFLEVEENPTTEHVAKGVEVARRESIDLFVALGGGSAMDCAKGVNLILTNGGRVEDYWGINKATKPMLPMIAVPTTAGTGSEAQSFALICDPITHQKMACGDRRLPKDGGLRPRAAILDPQLPATAPARVAAAAGIDAIAHSVETSGSTARNDSSRELSKLAWRLLSQSFPPAIRKPSEPDSWTGMLFGAFLAGAAIEESMLGAAHACANPLTARFGVAHGVAVGLMLPHVVRFNAEQGDNPYSDLSHDAAALADQLEKFLEVAGLPRRLRDLPVPEDSLLDLAKLAATQWTASFNPRTVVEAQLLDLYRRACG